MVCDYLTQSIVASNQNPRVGDTVVVTSTVNNTGTTTEQFHVVFSIQGGSVLSTTPVQTISPGGVVTTSTSFTVTTPGSLPVCADVVCDTAVASDMTIYPWDPMTNVKILPTSTITATAGNTISVSACRDQYQSASFIIRALRALTGVTITAPALTSAQGNTIPASAVDIRLVKVWYQASTQGWVGATPAFLETPELLVKDDSLVTMDTTNHINYVKGVVNGTEMQLDCSSPTVVSFPVGTVIHDAATLQPFSLGLSRNKQVWITIHVPPATPAGDYYGTIQIRPSGGNASFVQLGVKVLPFDLAPSPLEYAIYYYGQFNTDPALALTFNKTAKTVAQMTAELTNMKEHGFVYPTMNNWGNATNLSVARRLRVSLGLPTDALYLLGPDASLVDESPATLQGEVTSARTTAAADGFTGDVFITASAMTDVAATIAEYVPLWNAVHAVGGKVFAQCLPATVDLPGATGIDVAIIFNALDSAPVIKWHAAGKLAFSYGFPEGANETPATYRRNFGFDLWNHGYDGAAPYAYQGTGYGAFIWNDYDYVNGMRPNTFTYPVTDGVLDTIQWEGAREAINDVRYAATLSIKAGSTTVAQNMITASIAAGESMSTLRNKMITAILTYP
jgi:hypothetical protein